MEDLRSKIPGHTFRSPAYCLCKRWTVISFLILFFPLLSLFSQYTSLDNYDGLWTENATWVGGTAPPVTNIQTNVDIYGTVIRQGDLDYNKDSLHIHDTLIIYGNINLGNQVELVIETGGVFIVYGDYTSLNRANVSTGGTFVVLGDFSMLGSETQGSFENSGTVYIPNPVRVFDENGYTDLACADTSDYPDNCGYGNYSDLIEDPIFEVVAAGGYKIKSDKPLNFCLGDSVRLYIKDNADSYEWFLDGTTISGATGYEYYAKTGGDYTAQVIVGTDTFDLAAVTVTVYTPSTIPDSAYSSDTLICSGSPANITLSFGGGVQGIGATAMWYDDAALTSNIGSGNDLSITSPLSTTTYYVRFEGQCDTTGTSSVTVYVGSDPTPLIIGADTVCVPGQEIYSVSGTAGSTYAWTVTGGSINGAGTGTSITVDWTTAGSGAVEVTEATTIGCTATDNMNIEKFDIPDTGNLVSSGSLTRR